MSKSNGSRYSRDNMDVNSICNSNYSDGFILEDKIDINNSNSYRKSETNRGGKKSVKKKNSKAKVAVIISGIAALILIGGVCLYSFTDIFKGVFSTGNFKFDKNIYVDDVCLASMTYDEAKKALLAKEKEKKLDINITVKADDESVNLITSDFSYKYNTLDVLDEAKAYCESNTKNKGEKRFSIVPVLDEESVNNAVKKVCGVIEKKAENAKVTNFDFSAENMFTISAEKSGVDIDDEALKSEITKTIQSGKYTADIDAKHDKTEPKITKAFLEKNIKLLGQYETYSTNTANGTANMATALKACNNSIIEPGATWSFNACTGDSNLESNGYLPAGVISNGKLKTGIGGGICQASTTIYNAALLADLEIVERSNHRWPSSYAPIGLDATIDYPNLDLQLRNKNETQIFMGCSMSGSKLLVQIFGVKSDKYDEIKITSERGGSSDKVYYAYAARNYYKGGKLINTEELSSSTYYYQTSGSDNTDNSQSSKPSNSKPSDSPTESNTKPAETHPTEVKPTTPPTQPDDPQPPTEPDPTPAEPASPTE